MNSQYLQEPSIPLSSLTLRSRPKDRCGGVGPYLGPYVKPDFGPLYLSFLGGGSLLGCHHLLLVQSPPGLGTSLIAPLRSMSKVNDIDNALRFVSVLIIILTPSSVPVSTLFLDVVPQVPVLDEFFEMSFESLAVFGSVPILLVVGT